MLRVEPFISEDGNLLTISPKPDTLKAINMASEQAHIKHTKNTFCFFKPCFKTKAFCAPIASMRDSPSEKPEINGGIR
ncbi:MAG: hypothetical protein ACI8O8_000740 [Oleiphilaceae bacterium]|jgi:hypothetical protein